VKLPYFLAPVSFGKSIDIPSNLDYISILLTMRFNKHVKSVVILSMHLFMLFTLDDQYGTVVFILGSRLLNESGSAYCLRLPQKI